MPRVNRECIYNIGATRAQSPQALERSQLSTDAGGIESSRKPQVIRLQRDVGWPTRSAASSACTVIDGLRKAVLKHDEMRRSRKSNKTRKTKRVSAPTQARLLKKKALNQKDVARALIDPAIEQQMKTFEDGVQNFHQQKYAKAKPLFEKVLGGPGKDLADRARVHLRII